MGYTTGKKWTEKDIHFLKRNRNLMFYGQLAKALNTTESSVITKLSRLGIRRTAQTIICEHCKKKLIIKKTNGFYQKYCSNTCFLRNRRGNKYIAEHLVGCKICHNRYYQITESHLKKHHNISMQEYREKYPHAMIREEEMYKKQVDKLIQSLRKYKKTHHEYLSLAGKKGITQTQKLHPDKIVEGARKAMANLKRNTPRSVQKEWYRRGGSASMTENRLRKNIGYDNLYFDSKQEASWYKHYKENGIKVIPHFQIGHNEFDFYLPEKNTFHEHHPIINVRSYKKETIESYRRKRRRVLDKNGYKDAKLIVTTKPPKEL